MAKFVVPCNVLKQHNRSIYLFTMNSKKLLEIAYVLPKSRDKPAEIQRTLDASRLKAIGEYVQKKNCYLPNNIVLNLDKSVTFAAGGKRTGELIFPNDTGNFGYVLDGQHRLYGFKHANGVHFDLPVVAFINLPKDKAYKIFADINSLQTKVNEVLLQLLQYEIQDIGKAETMIAVSVAHDLNDHTDSPLQGKIKVYPDDKKTWIRAPSLARFLTPIVGPGGVLQVSTSFPQEKATRILKNYFNAVKAEYPEAWGNKNYVLTKVMGIEITCALFPNVYMRCQNFEHKKTDVSNFRRQLKNMGRIRLSEKEIDVEVDWSGSKFGALSSHKGIALLKSQILLALPPS